MIFRKSRRGQTGSTPPPPDLRCSFCNKSQRAVERLIAGPKVYICDKCVDICNDILAEDRVLADKPARMPAPPLEPEGEPLENPPQARDLRPVRCKLCGMVSSVEFCLPVAHRGWVCGACLDAVREVLDASSPEA
jgi:hypothetical protein